MMRRFADWSWARLSGPDRTVVLAAAVTRAAAVLLTVSFVSLAWTHLRHPGWSVMVAAVLAVECAAIVAWWLGKRRPTAATLLVDVPTVGAALVVAGAFAAHPRLGLWAGFVMPYSVVVAFTIGLACRTIHLAVLCGLLLVAVGTVTAVVFQHQRLPVAAAGLAMLIVNPVVGAASARLLRRGTAELDAADAEALRQLADVTAVQERARYAMALHDRVLQTLEALARSNVLADPGLHERVAGQAFWLRRYVDVGGELHDDDLATGIAETAWEVMRGIGTPIEINDAGIRWPDAPAIDASRRKQLIEELRHILEFLGTHCEALVLRATRSDTGIRVSILGSGGDAGLDVDRLNPARARLAAVGAMLSVEPIPYVEVHVPAAGDGTHPPPGQGPDQ
ncbi:hypothetical protein [Dactylosporangium sp. CA-092794]|uniref:hypothetical protein n=1 Tax=Dactylosporangium sp. CA-092794 TaxID=3239929 RepID=UPI003D8B2EE5